MLWSALEEVAGVRQEFGRIRYTGNGDRRLEWGRSPEVSYQCSPQARESALIRL